MMLFKLWSFFQCVEGCFEHGFVIHFGMKPHTGFKPWLIAAGNNFLHPQRFLVNYALCASGFCACKQRLFRSQAVSFCHVQYSFLILEDIFFAYYFLFSKKNYLCIELFEIMEKHSKLKKFARF